MKDFVELSKKWFDKQASVYDETDTLLYSKYGKISCQNIKNILHLPILWYNVMEYEYKKFCNERKNRSYF